MIIVEFIRFTVGYFAFNFAVWIIHLCAVDDGNNCRFWHSINSDPHTFYDITVIVNSMLMGDWE